MVGFLFSVVCGGVGIAVPIDKELQDDEIAVILRESEAECVIFCGRVFRYDEKHQTFRAGDKVFY